MPHAGQPQPPPPFSPTTECFFWVSLFPQQVTSPARLLPRPDTTVLTLYPMEGLQPGSIIGSVAPLEPLPRGQVTYMLVGGSSGDGLFVVDATTGTIYVAQELDYEAGARHTLQVSVEDTLRGYPSQRLVLVEIHVQDSNDHAPTWPQDPITLVVSESATPGISLFTFQALDGDGPGPNSQVSYSLLLRQGTERSPFQLDERSGELSLHGFLDRESQAAYLLVVQASDQALNSSQRHSAAVTVHIFVMDENDNLPEFLSPSRVDIPEDQPTGFLVLQVVARDRDLGENGRVSYTLRGGNTDGRFHLNPNTGKPLGWAGRKQAVVSAVQEAQVCYSPAQTRTAQAKAWYLASQDYLSIYL